MKLPLKTITITVCSALTVIFLYQAYWLYSLYSSQRQEMETAVAEAMRISDYNEMVLRIATMRKGNMHGEASIQAEYAIDKDRKFVNTGTQTTISRKDTDAVVIQKQDGWRDSLTIKRAGAGTGRSMSVSVHSQRGGNKTETAGGQEMLSKVMDGKRQEEDLIRLIQRGIHSGIDMIQRPDVNVYDSLLTARLNDRRIDSRHRLVQLGASTGADGGSHTDTLNVITTPGYTPSAGALVFDYQYGTSELSIYRLYIEPMGKNVLRQMTGILAASAATLVVLAFAFWYLIHTMLRQRSLDEMKDDFTHNVTHELKTPISVAYAANDALLNFSQGNDTATREKYLRIAQQQLLRLGAMVEQILSTSMERRKTFALRKETVDVESAIAPIMDIQKLKAQKPLAVTLDVMPHGLTVNADRQHFCQMISNICDNAIKYSKDDAHINICCRRDSSGNVTIAVSDQGIGIDKSHIRHIFEKFYRVPNGNIHEVSGYGLGLYYVATMMRLHGGTVDVRSEAGKGSTFTLTFNN